jgi:glucokinase
MDTPRHAIGVDLGATTIRGGIVDVADGTLVAAPVRVRTPRVAVEVVDAVTSMVGELVESARALGRLAVGIGTCGTVDPVAGRIIGSTDTMPGWAGTDLAAAIERATGLPCACDNDARAATLGEARFGTGRGATPFVLLTLGTGVGGGIALGDPPRLLHGHSFLAGHLGHVKVRAPDLPAYGCACGAIGCLEAYVSAWGFASRGWSNAAALFEAATRGEEGAGRELEHAAAALGAAFADIAAILNPRRIALAGGIARGWPALEARALDVFRAQAFDRTFESTEIVLATVDEPGIVGAACLTTVETSGAPCTSSR